MKLEERWSDKTFPRTEIEDIVLLDSHILEVK